MARTQGNSRKLKLGKQNRRTKWAPIWVVLKKFGMGKRIHPSRITRVKRSWRRTKLHIKPRKIRKRFGGLLVRPFQQELEIQIIVRRLNFILGRRGKG